MNEKLIVYNYHGLQASPGEYNWVEAEDVYVLGRDVFEKHLNFLMCMNYDSFDADDLASPEAQKMGLNGVMLTFDDGHISHFDHAMPLLKELGFKGTFFVSAGMVGKSQYMGWQELATLVKEGFKIGAHGYEHIPLTYLPKQKLRHELAGAKKCLEDKLGCEISSFSVPRGFYNAAVGRGAVEAGYKVICNSHTGYLSGAFDPLYIKRFAISKRTSYDQFKAISEGDWHDSYGKETIKEYVRRVLSPAFYDSLAAAKAKYTKSKS